MITLSFHPFHSFIENPLRTNKTITEEDKRPHINTFSTIRKQGF